MKSKLAVVFSSGLLGMALLSMARAEEAAPAAGTSAPAAAAAAPAKAAQALKADVKLGSGIEAMEPTGAAETFDESVGKVVGWSKITGAIEPDEITHVWIYKGNEIATVPLSVKSASYRTYSRKTVTGFVGAWTFQVKDSGGNVLAEKKFEVTAAAPASNAPASEPAAAN